MIENNEDREICAKCGGECCKGMGCSVFPQEFKEITVSSLTEKIKKGFCFDRWEGRLRGYDSPYFIRARNKNANLKIEDFSWGGECIFFVLGEGCSLSWEERPLGGRALIPHIGKCISPEGWNNKEDCCMAWIPYQDKIKEVIKSIKTGGENEIQR